MSGEVRLESVTLSVEELIDTAWDCLDDIRKRHDDTLTANSVEIRLWVAALLIDTTNDAILEDAVENVANKVKLLDEFNRSRGKH